jgi:hypothetical protein
MKWWTANKHDLLDPWITRRVEDAIDGAESPRPSLSMPTPFTDLKALIDS